MSDGPPSSKYFHVFRCLDLLQANDMYLGVWTVVEHHSAANHPMQNSPQFIPGIYAEDSGRKVR